MTAWRAIQTKPLQEPVAYGALHALGLPVFFPRMLIRGRHRAYFRAYIFADIDGVSIRRVVTSKGVVGIVGTVPIPQAIMVELMARADPSGLVPTPGPKQGDFCHLRKLANLLAVVENVDTTKGRVLVSAELLGHVRITIPLSRFEALTVP